MGRPPEQLVTDGPYGHCRNPMYLGHLLFLAGLALALRSPLAALLGAGQALTLLRHVQIDEERLARQFGAEYADYRARVSRWFSLGRGYTAGPRPFPSRVMNKGRRVTW
jgi:protein-S-isoprenylcysteine O-methyltransferase Ste14